MNSLNERKISLENLKTTALLHPLWALICVLLLFLFEAYFFVYPPRGYIAEDYVLSGSVKGQPLVAVQSLWESKLNDDEFMLEILEKSAIEKFPARSEALFYLNTRIRKNLRFSAVNEVLFKIIFVQPAAEKIRPFLNAFTDKFLYEIALLSREELENRRKNALFQFDQLLRRNSFVYQFFKPITAFEKLIPDKSGRLPEISERKESSWLGKIGVIVLNELNLELYRAIVYLKNHSDENQRILSLYPFESKLLTDPDMPPQTVQPYLKVFYLFIAVAVILVYLAGLIYFVPLEKNAENCANACA